MSQDANVLVMEEPTSALIIEETNRLFAIIRNLTARGVAVIYISHRLEEIFRIADRVTVRRVTLLGPWPGSSIDAGESPGHPAEDRF